MYVIRILLTFLISLNLFAATCDINNIVDEASGQFQRNRRQAMQKAMLPNVEPLAMFTMRT